ncbi:MAG: folate-binding protein [Lentilitoribacter sp.]
MPIENLKDRSVLAIKGADASTLLQGLVTANIDRIEQSTVVPCALLTPQGKIAFDFLLGKLEEDGYFFDMRTALVDDFQKRMTLYKLRADVQISLLEDWQPIAIWNEAIETTNLLEDTRFKNTDNVYRSYHAIDGDFEIGNFTDLRIAKCVAESDIDFQTNDVFPHDVYLDLNGGIDFKKGCYVGQEVVSRMQHRSSARKRIALIQSSSASLASGQELTANGKTIGKLGSVSETSGLAILRVDRYFDALSENHSVFASETEVNVSFPEWADAVIEPFKGAS